MSEYSLMLSDCMNFLGEGNYYRKFQARLLIMGYVSVFFTRINFP